MNQAKALAAQEKALEKKRAKALEKRKKNSKLRVHSNRQLTVLCLPAIIKIVVFSIIPMIWFGIAFVQFIPHKGLFGSDFVGFKNFELLFKSDLGRLLWNAIALNLLNMFIPLAVSIILGLLLFEIKVRWQLKIIQTILFFPFFISWPLVGTIISSMLNDQTGLITNIWASLFGERIRFYDDPSYWRGILTLANVWKNAGVNGVLYYAVLLGSDQEVYEAADIDGAGRWKKMWFLSLPALKLMVLLGLIQASANIIRVDFSWIYYCTNNSRQLYEVTETIEVYMFNALRTSSNFMIGTAVGLVQSVIGLILSLGINYIIKWISPGSSLY